MLISGYEGTNAHVIKTAIYGLKVLIPIIHLRIVFNTNCFNAKMFKK